MTTYPDLIISYLGSDMKSLCLILKLQRTSVGGREFSRISRRKRKQSFNWTGNVKKETIAMIKEIDNLLQNIILDQVMDLLREILNFRPFNSCILSVLLQKMQVSFLESDLPGSSEIKTKT